MAPLNQIEHALALADAGPPHEEQAHPVHVRERSMQGGGRREGVLDDWLDAPVELGGLEGGAKHRHMPVTGQVEQRLWRREVLGDEDGREVILEEPLERRSPRLRIQRPKERDLGLSEDVHPIRDESGEIPGQGKPRGGKIRVGHQAVEPEFAGQGLELQLRGGKKVTKAQSASAC